VHLLSIVGARPQFVKAAMITEAIDRYNRLAPSGRSLVHTLVHTGQHYDPNMSDCFFRELALPEPEYNLGVGSGTHAEQTALMLERLEDILTRERPDMTVVYGDTNSTLSGALAAVKLQNPVAHVEAGLRSFNRRMPEEINRVLTDHVSSLLFCPTRTAVENLRSEGIEDGVFLTGDVMLDAVLQWRAKLSGRSNVLERIGVDWGSFILLTIHRAENTDSMERLSNILESLLHLPYPVVFPIHPRTRARMQTGSAAEAFWRQAHESETIKAIDPVSYLDMLVLEENARIIVTDSGGVQKEAYFLGVPCLTVRGETEWIETLRDGWNTLVDPDDRRALPAAVVRLWETNGWNLRRYADRDAFGQGQAADQIVQTLAHAMSVTTGCVE
jgi:UDP-N-acetylglucosamine 2-epimerase